jgi:hypothetical protein
MPIATGRSDDDDDDFDLVFRRPSNSMYWILASSINEFSACTWLRPTPDVVSSMESSAVVLSIYNNRIASRTSSDSERGVQVAIKFTQSSEVGVRRSEKLRPASFVCDCIEINSLTSSKCISKGSTQDGCRNLTISFISCGALQRLCARQRALSNSTKCWY